jgi:hypothetical protein
MLNGRVVVLTLGIWKEQLRPLTHLSEVRTSKEMMRMRNCLRLLIGLLY